jgi:hypothetical protein
MKSALGKLATVAASVALLAACSSAPKATGPKLISFTDRQRSRIETASNNNTYGSIADRIGNLPQDLYAGTELAVSETILNEGLPSKGLRFTVKGAAVSDGMIGLPTEASVAGYTDEKDTAPNVQPVSFYADTTGGWQGTAPDVKYGSQIIVSFKSQVKKNGEGDIQMFIYPLDSKGQSSAAITHNYRVLDADANDVQVPTDN